MSRGDMVQRLQNNVTKDTSWREDYDKLGNNSGRSKNLPETDLGVQGHLKCDKIIPDSFFFMEYIDNPTKDFSIAINTPKL